MEPTYKLYIQHQKFDGSAYLNIGTAVDTYARWKVVCQEFPFVVNNEIKDLPKRDWHDEHGDDIFIPADGVKFKSYSLEASFIWSGGDKSEMRSDLQEFLDFVFGKKDSSGNPVSYGAKLAIYDEYTQTGRKDVVATEHSNDLYFLTGVGDEPIAAFKVKFSVNDPVTDIIYKDGSLVEA